LDEHQRQHEKKMQKRAANRMSAQLSRKRRKVFLEDLKDQNADLLRHHEILAVVPDAVFAFSAATGAVWFASTSAAAHFGLGQSAVESASFFDLMTADCSKRLRALIAKAGKSKPHAESVLFQERMTVCFSRDDKRLLGELSGRLSRISTGEEAMTCIVCVRPLGYARD
ncbi:unnamed protein product, partial [Phaeothamnion confervicola]